MWLGAWVSVFCTSRRLIRRKWTVTYQCQYFTIDSSISENDHKCETRNAQPEIRPDRSSQTLRILRVDGYRYGFRPPRVSGSGFSPGLEPNWIVFAVQSRTAGGLPGPVANTTFQTLQPTSPVILSTSRCPQAPLEWSKVFSDSRRAFSSTPECNYSNGGVFRILRDWTYRILKILWS